MQDVMSTLEQLIDFAHARGLIETEDLPWARNLLLDALELDIAPAQQAYAPLGDATPRTASALLDALCEDAIARGVFPPEPDAYREMFSARLMGLLTPTPSAITNRFTSIERAQGIAAATDWFYALCRDNNYIRVDDIARNVVFSADSPVGELVLTINLSKPEKDPKTIALERSLPASGYPKCQLCVENTGYAGRLNFPARQNHRMVPLALGGERWHLQYSPYLYYDEHCIVLNDTHKPMRMTDTTFAAMFDFVDRFPHYFIGSNTDLPIVGGSILSHDHFQGGRQSFPMTRAPIAQKLRAQDGVEAGIVRWPLSSVRLTSAKREPLIAKACALLAAWRDWSDEEFGICAQTDAPHNAITPTLRKEGEVYVLDLVLRNNLTSDEHPLGIFHPHADLHHIKRENIGLIEVMGLFILPGRLLAELAQVEKALCAQMPPTWEGDMQKHQAWLCDIRSRHGVVAAEDAERVLREELAAKCARVLADCGVYPASPAGEAGMLKFLACAGWTAQPS